MHVISAASKLVSRPEFSPEAKRSARYSALRKLTRSDTAQLNDGARAQTINLTEIIMPQTFAFCEQLAQASDDVKGRLRGVPATNVHALQQFPLLALMVNTQAENGSIRKRQVNCGRQSFFESVTECSCTVCTHLLQKSVILRALRSAELRAAHVNWFSVVQTEMNSGCIIPFAALLQFINAAAPANLDADQQW